MLIEHKTLLQFNKNIIMAQIMQQLRLLEIIKGVENKKIALQKSRKELAQSQKSKKLLHQQNVAVLNAQKIEERFYKQVDYENDVAKAADALTKAQVHKVLCQVHLRKINDSEKLWRDKVDK